MSRTRREATLHGDVEYETVDCASCGHEVVKEEANEAHMGDVVDEDYWSHRDELEIEFDAPTHKSRWFCDFCTDEPTAVADGFRPDPKLSLKYKVGWALVGAALTGLALFLSGGVAPL